jgi:hypothetical protein
MKTIPGLIAVILMGSMARADVQCLALPVNGTSEQDGVWLTRERTSESGQFELKGSFKGANYTVGVTPISNNEYMLSVRIVDPANSSSASTLGLIRSARDANDTDVFLDVQLNRHRVVCEAN